MKRFDPRTFVTILSEMNNSAGYKLDATHYIRRDGYNFGVYKTFQNNTSSCVMQFEIGPTLYCCGVGQLGNFAENEHAKRLSDDILKLIWRILITFARNQMNKGIINGWFYKQQASKTFYHPTVEKMFKLGGAKRAGKITFNPNSHNKIKAYLFTIV
jgi:hypothetical protein